MVDALDKRALSLLTPVQGAGLDLHAVLCGALAPIAGLGVAMCIVILRDMYYTSRLAREGVEGHAKIVTKTIELITVERGRPNIQRTVEYEFTTQSKDTPCKVQIKTSQLNDLFESLTEGDIVPVVYLPEKPHICMLKEQLRRTRENSDQARQLPICAMCAVLGFVVAALCICVGWWQTLHMVMFGAMVCFCLVIAMCIICLGSALGNMSEITPTEQEPLLGHPKATNA